MATEKRLIDKDALMERCDAPHWCVWMSEIEDFPTVDAVGVVHGRWKHQYEKGMSYKVCSICGCRNGLDLKFNYCPNCGAKMDGESK